MRRSFLTLAPVILLVLFCAACTAAAPSPTMIPPTREVIQPTEAPTATSAPTETSEPASAEIVLTISGPNGEKTFTMDDLKKLPVAEGHAGIKSSTGRITIPAQFTGVELMELANQAGGLDTSMGVNAVAEDGYAMTFSYDQITKGDFIAYDPAIGDEKKMAEPLKVILAYAREGQPLDRDSDGTLRLAIISPKNNQVTDGHWSVKWVNRLEIKPLGAEWDLQLTGVISDTVDRNSFQSCAASLCHQGSWTDDKAQKWVGVPLWYLVGRMDDSIKHDGPAFNQALVDTGYSIQLIATDGYSVTLQSAQVSRNNNILLAYQVNENPLPDKYFPLRLVGDELQKNQLIGQVAEIKMLFDAVTATQAAGANATPTSAPIATPAAPPATVQGDLTITGLVDNPLGLNEADLKKMEVLELTAEHPKKGKETYQGIRLNALLELAGLKPAATRLAFTAADGYTAEVNLSDLLACTDCLLAFTNTPGKFKLVMPGMESSLWVKDVASIEAR
jgi:DMSO/TMAO reductase YedYZ molybdopterin-dependent catalytic subunit